IEQRMLDGFLAQILDARRAISPRVDDAVPPEPGVGNAAVPDELTVGIRPAFPWVDRREVRGSQRRDPPLRDRQVRNARQTDLAAAPGLNPRPLDQVVEVF